MKIAAEKKMFVSFVLGGLVLTVVSGAPSLAQPMAASGVAAPVGGASSVPPGPVVASDAAGQGASPVKEVLSAIQVAEPKAPAPMKSGKKGKTAPDEDEQEDVAEPGSDKIPDSVKGVVKRLSEATKDVTIEDLNEAREAVVKLDVLIDIEKRLNDLTTLRQERESKENDFSGAIPESALGGGRGGSLVPPAMAPSAVAPVATPPVYQQMPMLSEKNIEVTKVVGASGRYVAAIKDMDGSERQIRVGDKLAGGAVVEAISKQGVTITKSGGKKEVVQVKDITVVFGGR